MVWLSSSRRWLCCSSRPSIKSLTEIMPRAILWCQLTRLLLVLPAAKTACQCPCLTRNSRPARRQVGYTCLCVLPNSQGHLAFLNALILVSAILTSRRHGSVKAATVRDRYSLPAPMRMEYSFSPSRSRIRRRKNLRIVSQNKIQSWNSQTDILAKLAMIFIPKQKHPPTHCSLRKRKASSVVD